MQRAPKEERLASLESLRVLAILGVISQHTLPPEMFLGLGTTVNLLVCLTDPIQRFVVPFFFMLSGYWFGKSLQSGVPAPALLLRYAKRLIPLFIVWSVIYSFIPSTPNWWEDVSQFGVLRPLYWQFMLTIDWITLHPLALLWFGTIGHLWFLPALLVALAAVTLLGPFKLVYRKTPVLDVNAFGDVTLLRPFTLARIAIPLAAILYVVGLIERSDVITLPHAPLLSYYFRTGLFMALLFTMLGWWLSFNLKKPNLSLGVFLVLAGYSLQVIEETTLWHYIDVGPPNFGIGQYLLGTVPFCLGIFVVALARPNIGRSTMLPFLASLTLGVYLSHLLIVRFLNPVRVWLHHPLWDFALPFVVYLLSVLLTVILSRFTLTNNYLVQVRGAASFLMNMTRRTPRVATTGPGMDQYPQPRRNTPSVTQSSRSNESMETILGVRAPDGGTSATR